MVANKTLVFKKIPTGIPVAGEHLALEERPFDIDAIPAGGLIVKVLTVSFDPYLRDRMRDPSIPLYQPAFALDGAVENFAVGRVLKSDSDKFSAGDLIHTVLPFAEYAAVPPEFFGYVSKIHNHYNLDLDLFLAPLGLPGITAYSSVYELGHLKKGETIFISSAAGAVGSVVGQLAKREGLTVIGSVGSDEKLDFITKELGFDAGFNYKKERAWNALKRLAPEGIDIYYDNVGGEQLEGSIENLKVGGRIIVCGMLDNINKPLEERFGVRNLPRMYHRRLTMTGFVVSDDNFWPKYGQRHQEDLQKWIAEGGFKAPLQVTHGLDHAIEGFLDMFHGKIFGKAVLKIKE
ncbi:NAD(P)-binding protein [Hypoxylon trugodes]|uniref:NAD(P)-binding protein n=1 Tax=Hypoxylon trugodes TaxID=326681 RepID=UPI00219B9F89|nr:NAD(P)-binding protein [Hypoxylon trugodes]KAI1382641.1 NAD(P)-binding protein [Hypoxylon trugodes]